MSMRWRPSKKALGSEHPSIAESIENLAGFFGLKGISPRLSRSSTPQLRAEEVSGVVAAATLRACAGGRRAQPSFVARCTVTSCACLSAQPPASFGGDACAPKYIEPISTAIRATRRTTGVRLAHGRVGQQAGVSLRALKQPAPAISTIPGPVDASAPRPGERGIARMACWLPRVSCGWINEPAGRGEVGELRYVCAVGARVCARIRSKSS